LVFNFFRENQKSPCIGAEVAAFSSRMEDYSFKYRLFFINFFSSKTPNIHKKIVNSWAII
jgi:hypothetical protein